MNLELLYQRYLQSGLVCTDTRQIKKGCIFFALKGDNFDGNAFAVKALEAGASYAVIDDPSANTDPRCMLVSDVLSTLQDLARHHRQQQHIPFVAITGTNGKPPPKSLSILFYRSIAKRMLPPET